MKWKNGLTRGEYIKRKTEWHRWFAWYPVKIGTTDDGHHIKLWLEFVDRKGYYHQGFDGDFFTYTYQEIHDGK